MKKFNFRRKDEVNEVYEGDVEFKKKEKKTSILVPFFLILALAGLVFLGLKFKESRSNSKPIYIAEDNAEIEVSEDSPEEPTSLINKNILAYTKTGFITLYDENEKVIDEIRLFPAIEDDEGEDIENTIEQTLVLLNKSDNNSIFKSNRGDIFLVSVEDDKLQGTKIMSNGNKISIAYVYEDNFYAIKNSNLLIKQIDDDEEKLVELFDDINNLIVTEDGIVLSANEKLYLADFDGSIVDSIVFGEKTEDIFKFQDSIYAINDFGKGKNNSILVDISVDSVEKLSTDDIITISKEFHVNKITELKGKRSKYVDLKDSVLFVEQMESVKSINLLDMSPGKSYKKSVKKSRGFINNDYFYEITGDKVLKYDLNTNEYVKTELSIANKYLLLNK